MKTDRKITCFMPYAGPDATSRTIKALEASGMVRDVYVMGLHKPDAEGMTIKVHFIESGNFFSSSAVRKMADSADTDFILVYSKPFALDPGRFSLERMMQVCDSSGAGMVYSGYWENREGKLAPHPVITCQPGSLRDDFNFGSLVLYRNKAFKSAAGRMKSNFRFAGFYDLRLKLSEECSITDIPELLYTEIETDTRKSGEKQFDYVDPRNRAVQEEMEQACTEHLKAIGGWLKPEFGKIEFSAGSFDFEASVIIPVRNRAKTIGDAIESVLKQKASFRFNLIVVDNHSADGTSDIIRSSAAKDKRIVHIIPERNDLGIGGCWNEGIFHDSCGKFSIQLDSDDLYIDDTVVSRIVEAFYAQQCAMVIGSYKMVNFKLEDIPPGIIDHREWTPENGRNNALRINGLGAPRAFYTPVLRNIRIPNVSYGEDYAVGLAISRHYQIGRIYEPLYLCRRWDENSDAALDVNKVNANNHYKDTIRTYELMARIQLNKQD